MLARIALLAALAIAACSAPAPTPSVVELALVTSPGDACPDALMGDVTLVVAPDVPGQVVAVGRNGGRIQLVFPAGTRGLYDVQSGAIQLLLPREEPLVVLPGQRVSFGGGQSGTEADNRFFACSIVR